jgi:hypothetical protein
MCTFHIVIGVDARFSDIPKTEFYFSHPILLKIVEKLFYTV